MVTRIVKEDSDAKKRLIELWTSAISTGKLDELNLYIDEIADLLQESQELNFKRWDILSKPVHQNFQALGSYDAELQVVKTYVDKRIQSFDELIRK